MTLRAVVADDEALGRERLVRMLEAEPDVEVVAACADGRESLEAVRKHAPDVAFLDVQMPGVDGLGVINALRGHSHPEFVLVTAYDVYAVQAFDLHAVDYILKPFSQVRLRMALARVRERRAARSAATLEQALTLLKALGHRAEHPSGRIAVRTHERTFFLKTECIDWIEAAGKYLHVHVGKLTHKIRGTMASLEQTLDPSEFVRISRSAIVKIDCIQEIQPWFQGVHLLILRDRTQLTSTRRYRRNLRHLLGK